jgi:hypothetical protein
MGEWKGLLRPAVYFNHLVELEEVKGLPRATFNNQKNRRNGKGRGCLESPFEIIKKLKL